MSAEESAERQPTMPCSWWWLMRCATVNECTIPLVDATNAALCVANVAFLAHIYRLFVRELRITHLNFAMLRFTWIVACSLISVSTLLQSICRLYVTYSVLDDRRPSTPVIMVPYSRRLLAICFVGSDLIRSLTIIMPVERALATFRCHDYEANPSYLVVGPLLVLLTLMVGIPVAMSGAYEWISVTAITAVLLSMDAAGFSMTCAVMWLNRRLKTDIGRRLSQRYQVSENIRVLTQMRALSIIEVIFQSVSILFVAYSYVSSPATYKREGPFVTYTVSSTLNAYVTASMITIFHYRYRRKSDCRWKGAIAGGGIADAQRRATAALDEHDRHFAALRSAWATTTTISATVVKA